jgi:autotransporter passenger strand-loop-strand repeat protein
MTTSTVSSGQTSTGLTVVAGETLTVNSGGTIVSTQVNSGGAVIINAGVDSATTILAGGYELVQGPASGAAVNVSGDQIYGSQVISAATAQVSNETVYAGGELDLFLKGGVATGVTVSSGGTLNISANATASNTTLSGGGSLVLESGKASVAGSLTFAGGGNRLAISGSTTSGFGFDVGSGAQAPVIIGFTTGDKIDMAAFTTATVSMTQSSTGGNTAVNVVSGGTTVETFVFSGAAISGHLSLTSGAGGVAEIVYVSSGGSGGNSGGVTSTVISSGVTSTGLIVSSGQTLAVQSGGSVVSTTVLAGGSMVVSGSDQSAVISAGGAETVYGSASGDQIYGAATDNGIVASATVQSGGSLVINGADSATTILAGGNETVFGSASGDQIYGTQLVSAATAVVTNETVHAGGALDLFLKGAVSIGATVSSGGALNINGNAWADNTTLVGGGLFELQSPKAEVMGSLTFSGGGNTLEITAATSGGFGFGIDSEVPTSLGLKTDTPPSPSTTNQPPAVISGSAQPAVISGFSATDKIDITSAAYVGTALTLSQAVSGDTTIAQVISGGLMVETFVFADPTLAGTLGLQYDGAGGVDLEVLPMSTTTTVSTSTPAGVYSETATNTLLVVAGGSVSSATIEGGAFLTVAGGVDSAAIIMSGGFETVSTGSAAGDQIYGSAVVSGGSATGETVLAGGRLDVAGGSVSNVTLSGGGVVALDTATASLTGTLTFSGGDNTLEADVAAAGGAGDQALISGFSTADKIEVKGVALSDATLSFTTDGSGHSTATVSGDGVSESFVFNDPTGAYNSSTMSLMSDGSGVDLIVDTTPDVTITSLGGATNAATTIVNGTVDTSVDPEAVGTTVSVSEGGTVVGTAVVGANGHWSAKVTFENDAGTNALTASDTDKAGNTGVTSGSVTYDVNTTAAAFTPGNLVLSVYGDADGSGQYSLDQASAITLEQITTDGSVVGQFVLPQTTTTVNGKTEYGISGEYGSASEGALQLSSDGHSLVIMGYGVDPQLFDSAGGVAVYGTSALGQTTSLSTSSFTAVPRIVADINANGVVDTSTALYNVFNTNNPRSVSTTDGSAFWISGQGVKGDATQGVWYAADGASGATRLYGATDTRLATIYNGQLYVSVDTTQGSGGTTGIEAYGGLPNSATTPTFLQGLGPTVALTAANANGVNNANIGKSVDLSPESFFFANANTLYVADGGVPKNGGVGDGGLQKWVFDGTQWNLQYTLSAGLNLVANSAASGTTGLYGLTGKVVGDQVQLYATSETVGELDQSYAFAITDTLGATSGAGESFTTIATAGPDQIIRGIAFAPTAYAPTISGAVAGQTTAGEAPVNPFAGVTITDPNSQAMETLTITVGGAGGTLAGDGISGGTGGVYTLSGSAAAVTSELDALSFTPAAGAAMSVSTTTFSLSDLSSANSTPTVDTTTTVADTVPPAAPTIGALVGEPVDGATVEVTGTGDAETTVTLYADGGTTAVGSGVVGSDGSFDITTTTTFSAGAHNFTAKETDAAGLTSKASGAFLVSVLPPSQTYTLTKKADTIHGSGGNNTIIAAVGTLNAGDVIDGGPASNTLQLVGGGSFNLQTPTTLGDISVVQAAEGAAASLQTIIMRDGLNVTVDVTSSAGGKITITGANDSDVFNLGDGADTVTLGSANETVKTGAGGDTIKATAATAGALIEGAAATATMAVSGGGTVTLNVGDTSLAAVTLAAASSAYTVTLNGEAGLAVTDNSTIVDTITLGAAGQTVTNGVGGVIINATSATAGDLIKGGAGKATINVTGGGLVALNAADAGVTALNLASSSAAYTVAASTLAALTITDDSAGADVITVGAATQTVNGGAGDDTINVTAATAHALIRGGAGTTTVNLTGGGKATLNAADTGLTAINLASAASAYSLTLVPGFNGVVTDLSTGADSIVGANDSATIKLGSGADTVTLGSANETVITGAVGDTIKATAATAGALIEGAPATATMAVSGGGNVTLNAGDTSLAAVNLASSTTAYTLTTNDEAGLTVYDLSSAADTINLGGANQTVAGGTGLLNGDSIGNFMAAGDVIDLTNLNIAKLKPATFTENAAGTSGVLSVTDGTHKAAVTLFGQFMAAGSTGTAAAAGFHFASDGASGTSITWTAPTH